MKAKKRYRVERWNDAVQRWDCIVGSEDNKSYAYGSAHGILLFYPCPRIRVAENEGMRAELAEWQKWFGDLPSVRDTCGMAAKDL